MDLVAVGNALEDLKKLQGLVDDAKDKEHIVDLRSVMVDMKEEIVNLREENISLKKEAQTALERERFLDRLVEIDGYLYDADQDGNPAGYPYCPVCLRAEEGPFKLLRLSHQTSVCPSCTSKFRVGTDGVPKKRKSAPVSDRSARCATT